MTDDLVQRLRDDYQKTVELCAEAADRIEELEKAIRTLLSGKVVVIPKEEWDRLQSMRDR